MKTQHFVTSLIIFLLFTFTIGVYTGKAQDNPTAKDRESISAQLLQKDKLSDDEHEIREKNILYNSIAIGENLSTNQLYSIDIGNPGSIEVIANVPFISICGDFQRNDPTKLWIIDLNDDHLKAIDIETGAINESYAVPCPLPGGLWTCLASHPFSGHFYAVAANNEVSAFYLLLIQESNVTVEYLFQLEIPAIMSGMFDYEGMFYMLDVVQDLIYKVNVMTQEVVGLGQAGFDATDAQGMGYDPVTGNIYLAAYHMTAGPQLRILDKATGSTTYIASIPYTGAFAFPLAAVAPAVYAGEDQTVNVCEEGGQAIELYGMANNYDNIHWSTTNGLGWIENEDQLNATYYPSVNDPENLDFQLEASKSDKQSIILVSSAVAVTLVWQGCIDFGDTPDDPAVIGDYPTLQISDGARHSILLAGNIYLGNRCDGEINGVPHQYALGDDLANLDDEDGVKWRSNLVSGQPCSIDVTASGAGKLDAWVDFNRSGNWEPGEQIFTSTDLFTGINSLVFDVPSTANSGPTFARFRLSVNGGLSFTGFSPDGEVEDYRVFINQPLECKMHYPQYPDPFGWDINITAPNLAADDWMCTETGNVDDIHFWISSRGDTALMHSLETIITSIDISIHADIPANISPTGYSMPADPPLWQRGFLPGQFDWQIYLENPQGWYSPADNLWILNDHYLCALINIDSIVDPFVQQHGNIYWLEIMINTCCPEYGQIGWKTTLDHWNDDAVWNVNPYAPLSWNELLNPSSKKSTVIGNAKTGFDSNRDLITQQQQITPYDFSSENCEVGSDSPAGPIKYADANFDLQFQYPCGDAAGEAGIETDGNFIYTTRWNDALFFKYQIDGTFLGSFSIPGVERIRDLAFDGTYFYGSPASTTIYEMDFNTTTLVNTFTVATTTRAIAYDESANGFWVNNWSTSIFLYDRNGNTLNTIPTISDEYYYGFAWDPQGPYLWGYSQKTGTSRNMLYKMSLPSGTIIEQFDVLGILLFPATTNPAGGLYMIADLIPGTYTLGGLVQNSWLWGVEMGLTGTVPVAQESLDLAFLITGSEIPLDSLDYGDAPDDPSNSNDYPTFLASDGARHPVLNFTVVPLLGNDIDFELNGQPDVNATGDDLAGIDDETGIQWRNSLVPGQSCSVDVTVSGTDGKLDAWIDFNRDGNWTNPADRIFSSVNVVTGVNTLTFSVPADANTGPTYARFRVSINGGLSYTGLAPDGEVEDYRVFIHHPIEGKMHYPQYPDPTGWDINISNPNVVADDWMCVDSGPVNDIHFWVSSRWDIAIMEGLDLFITAIDISIHSDIPAAESPTGFSMPADPPLWQRTFLPGQYTWNIYLESPQGWYTPAENLAVTPDHNLCAQINIDNIIDPFVQELGNIYWLEIMITTCCPEYGQIGWKTSPDHWNDDAVWNVNPYLPLSWNELLDPISGESLDMSFVITGDTLTDPKDYGDAPAPYPTLLPNGARHGDANPAMRIGWDVDWELNGQPHVYALGDDLADRDDEKNISIPDLRLGTLVNIGLNANIGGGYLNAWIDFDRDGNWSDAGEQIALNWNLSAGFNPVPVTVPATASVGYSYARFRYSSSSGLSYDGFAPDGEVQDYLVQIIPVNYYRDHGDAPDDPGNPNDYPTLLASGGAEHRINTWPCLQLGNFVDVEIDGLPSINADADDLWPESDDEDGITFGDRLVPGEQANIAVLVGGNPTNPKRYLSAWIDYNIDGDWNENNERVFNNAEVENSGNHLTFNVPITAQIGTTYARFRLSSWIMSSYTGSYGDGEVEDYMVQIDSVQMTMDYGDAPAPYPTLRSDGGARHGTHWTHLNLGDLRDLEDDGQPNPQATGDDTNPAGLADDEEGVKFLTTLVPGLPATVSLYAPLAVNNFQGWIDFNANGNWSDPIDRIITNIGASKGWNNITFNVPPTATQGLTHARFRYSSELNIGFTGFAFNGEVEDYQIYIGPMDFGDAPDDPDNPNDYPTYLASDGARHGNIPSGIYLSNLIDYESDGQPDLTATGDNIANLDDEKGITFLSPLIPGVLANVSVAVSSVGNLLNAWIDFDRNGSWSPAEQIFTDFPIAASPIVLNFNVPAGATVGPTFARFRYSQSPGLQPTGFAPSGEVEDYHIEITNQSMEIDYGDVPDDPANPNDYPTWSASNGACHGNNPPGIFMGDLIDFELDGQPNPTATGDDLNNQDDGDGVTFLTPLIPGGAASVSIDVSVTNWYLNAWVDFNGDRDWNDAGEQIALDAIMTLPSNTLNFSVPIDALLGRTYARFRYSCEPGLQPFGISICGEVEDYAVYIVQPGTPKMHWPQMPKLGGWDVDFNNSKLADDFLCTESGPISFIRFWISWNDNLVGVINNLGIRFLSNIPEPVPPVPGAFSKPGVELWQRTFLASQLQIVPMDDSLQGWFSPINNTWNRNDHDQWYQVTISNIPEPFIQSMGTIYWMELDFGYLPNIGWKQTDDGSQAYDASVFWNGVEWLPIYDPDPDPPVLTKVDLSFIISSTPIFTINATASPSIIVLGGNVQLDVDVTGGSGTNFYSWTSNPPGFSSTLKNPIANPLVSTTYFVAVTDVWSFLTDQINVSVILPPTANAGTDATICDGNVYALNGVATDYSSVLWTTSGDGIFSNPNILDPVYTPGVLDITTGTVTLTLTANAIPPCTTPASDDMVLTIQLSPTANAGTDATICDGNVYALNGVATDYSSVLWTTSGDGIFSNPNILDPFYAPGPTDITIGSVVLTLAVFPIPPCTVPASDNMVLTISNPTCDAGSDVTICQSDNYSIDATGTGVGIIYSWSPATFLNNPNIEDPTFGPAPPGNYLLTLTVTDIYGCQDQDQVLITVLPEQTIILPLGLSGISSYLVPVIPNPDIAVMFSTVVSDLIILYNSTMSYTPPAAPSPPGVQWNPYLGYQIRMAQTRSLTICGPEAAPPVINLVTGWNLIPILNATNIDIVPGLSSISQIQVIREIGGPRFWWRNGASSLNVVEPGKAYLVQVSGTCSIDFGPLKGGAGKASNPDFTNTSPWNNVAANLPAHLFAFTKEACSFFENGDIVGIFTPSGLCAGMWFYDKKSESLGVAAFGDDTFTGEVDGFTSGQPVQFRLYRLSSEDVFDISVVYDPSYLTSGIYTEDGLSLISGIELTLLGNKELANSSLQIYPNPGTGLFNIAGLKGLSNVTVLNSTGTIIFEEQIEDSGILNLTTQPKGIYIAKITSKKEVMYRKIIIQ